MVQVEQDVDLFHDEATGGARAALLAPHGPRQTHHLARHLLARGAVRGQLHLGEGALAQRPAQVVDLLNRRIHAQLLAVPAGQGRGQPRRLAAVSAQQETAL